jgi:hypothetical protein
MHAVKAPFHSLTCAAATTQLLEAYVSMKCYVTVFQKGVQVIGWPDQERGRGDAKAFFIPS